MINKPYAITQTCATCRGEGLVPRPHCRHCGQELTEDDPWWVDQENLDDHPLPCGHEQGWLQLQEICPECAGSGRKTRHLSAAEWEVRRRRRLARRLFVVVVTFIFVTAVSFMILREPGTLCGSLWYGLAAGAWLLRGLPL